MRIQLRAGKRVEGERGAVAVITAILISVVFLGLAAVTTDLGVAYVFKRQAQSASDAASLAAAQIYAQDAGRRDCADLAADNSLRAAAQTAADQVREANFSGSSPEDVLGAGTEDILVDCEDGQLTVGVWSARTSPLFFGRIFTASGGTAGRFVGARYAKSIVEPPGSVTGLRPYAICSRDTPNPATGDLVTVYYPETGPDDPACPKESGNWWTLRCPGGASGSSALADATRNGCANPVSVVPDQEAHAAALRAWLLSNCDNTGNDPDCLTAEPGNSLANNNVLDAWESLLGRKIVLPVFCGPPDCSPPATDRSGSNAKYPVYRFAAVRVCGYWWGDKDKENGDVLHDPTPSPAPSYCAGADVEAAADATPGDNKQDRFLQLQFLEPLVVSGTSEGICSLGAGCDGGLRQTRLVK